MKPVHVLVLGLAVAVMGLAMRPGDLWRSPSTWPTAAWTTSTPEEQGLDSAQLADLVERLRHDGSDVHSLTVVRNGRLVLDVAFYPYRAGDLHDMASVTKSVVTTLVGAAIQDGYLQSSEQTLASLLPQSPAARRDEAHQRLRLDDLLSMRPGLQWSDDDDAELHEMRHARNWSEAVLERPVVCEPGTRFVYCSGGMHVLSAVISQATGENAAAYARERLFQPLGIDAFAWPADRRRVTHGWGDLHLRPTDAAKLGLLWLGGGQWDGRSLVPTRWMHDVTRERSTAGHRSYGEGFWVDERARPPRFQALGRGGQQITVVPAWNLVVVVTAGGLVRDDIEERVLQAVTPDQGLPENLAAFRRLTRTVARAAEPPPPSTPRPLPARAARVSRLTFRCPRNLMGLEQFRIRFDGSAEASTDMKFARFDLFHPRIGLDGVARTTPGGRYGLPVGLKGAWESDDVFAFDYDEIANINQFHLRLRFSGDGPPTVEMSEKWSRTRVAPFVTEIVADGP